MPRRSLLAIGTCHYNEGFDNLDDVPQAVEMIAHTFAELGFETTPLVDLTKSNFDSTVRTFLTHDDWGPEDTAVVYVTGHGITHTLGRHFLAVRDSEYGDYNTCVRTDSFLESLPEPPKLRRLLLMIDTCYAQSGADAMKELTTAMRREWPKQPGREFWVLASARYYQEAQQLMFARAFRQALADLRSSYGKYQATIGLYEVRRSINQLLGSPDFAVEHRAVTEELMSTTDGETFFDNPNYQGPATTLVASEVADEGEFTSHWVDRARGGAPCGSPSLFEGRETVIADILGWNADPSRPDLLVVTAAPGTGKSALLAQFVVNAGLGHQLGVIKAIHAHGLPAESIRERVSGILDDPPMGATVIIDSLDEATNSGEMEELVLEPLLARGIKVVAGMRPALARTLRVPAEKLDLDQNFDADEVHRYVCRLLLESQRSPYIGDPQHTGPVADAVVILAGGNFLLAQKIANTLSQDERPMSPADVLEARQSFGSLAAVFDRDLSRIDDESGRVRELLSVLAWSRGSGFPWEGVWPALGRAMFPYANYTNDDVQRVLSTAGDYVVETPVGRHSYYRLYHELFAEHLRKGADAADVHQRITNALISATPTTPDGNKDWVGAHPYVLDFLAEHAARGGALNDLLADATLVLAMEPIRLGVALSGRQREGVSMNEAAVLRCLQHLQSRNAETNASHLTLAALQSCANELACSASTLAEGATWRPLWAWWRPANASRVIGELPSSAEALAALMTEHGAFAIAGGKFGIEVWDINSGRRLAVHPGHVLSLAAGHVDGQPIVLAGHADGMVTVHELPSLRRVARNQSKHSCAVQAAVMIGGGSSAATGDADGSLVLWQLPTLRTLAERLKAHVRVCDLATTMLDGTPLLISAGDTFEAGYRRKGAQPVRAWALPALRLHSEVETEGSLSEVVGAISSPHGCIVVFQKGWGYEVKLIAADGTVKLIGTRDERISELLVLAEGDEPEMITLHGTLALLRINPSSMNALILGPHFEVEYTHFWTGPVGLNDRRVLLSADTTLRAWDLDDLLATSSQLDDLSQLGQHQHEHLVKAVACAGEVLVVLTSDGTARRWLWRSAEALEPLAVRLERIEALTNCVLAGKPHFAVAYCDGVVEAFDAKSGERWQARLEVAAPLHAMAVGEQEGRTVAATAVRLGLDRIDQNCPFYGIRLWDLTTGAEIPTQTAATVKANRARGMPDDEPDTWKLVVGGYQDRKLDLAAVEKDDYLLIVAHNSRGLTVWPLNGDSIGEQFEVGGWALTIVQALAAQRDLLAVGDLDGRWGLWCLDTMRAVEGEHRGLRALEVGKYQGASALLSGGTDGWLRVWSQNGAQIESINVDEWITALAALPDEHVAVGTRRGVVIVQFTATGIPAPTTL